MATTTGEEEVQYESDPEEVKRSLAMRRREASDDEEGEGDREADLDRRRGDRMAEIRSDVSDGQGGVAEYNDDEDDDLVLEDECEEGYDEQEEDINEEEVNGGREHMESNGEKGKAGRGEGPIMFEIESYGRRTIEEAMDLHGDDHVEEEEQEKGNELFSVPTAGAFYMHDDRFQDSAGGRQRRMRGGRKPWESKDDGKWGHDKFEEMNTQERQHEERRRTSRGHYRGRGRNRIGYARGTQPKAFNSNDYPNHAPKVVMRGRGPRRYESAMRNNNQASPMQQKQSGNSLEETSCANSRGVTMPTTNADTAMVQTEKNALASSLNSASPPFYPAGSSNNSTQKKNMHGELEKLHINSSTLTSGKAKANKSMPSGSSRVNSAQSFQARGQRRGVPLSGQVMYQPVPAHNQINRVSSATQVHNIQKGSVQNRSQPSRETFGQQSGRHPVTRSQASSPPTNSSLINSYPADEVDPISKKFALVAKGKESIQASGKGSFLYGGAQVMGAAGNLVAGHGDQNFPAFLPVMQFGGQHSGGMGVPALGMAFPGYVTQSQPGVGSSEMTWLPILTRAGGLGASYCSPYVAADGSCHALPVAEQPSSAGSSGKENMTNKPNGEFKPLQRPELAKKEFLQQQSNPNKQPRRYSEMNFSK